MTPIYMPTMTHKELADYRENTKHMANTDATRKYDFDGTNDYLSRKDNLEPGYSLWVNGKCEFVKVPQETYTIVFKKPLSKKQWRKMSKKYGIDVALRTYK